MKKTLKVLFHHGDFPVTMKTHAYFGANGPICQNIKKVYNGDILWTFKGGHLNDSREYFWGLIKLADVLFTRTINMNHEDVNMDWHQAEDSMISMLKKIKLINPEIKIFFFEDKTQKKNFKKYGTFIHDLHKDERMITFFKRFDAGGKNHW